jgi:hypothetical protein
LIIGGKSPLRSKSLNERYRLITPIIMQLRTSVVSPGSVIFMQMRTWLSFLVLSTVTSVWSQSARQNSRTAERFVINKNRPYVYVRFDHMGKGVPLFDDEPSERVWLRFVNNCTVSIVLETFRLPDGSAKGEVGLIHGVVRDQQVGLNIEDENDALPPLTIGAAKQVATTKMPAGYIFDVVSSQTVAPGEFVLFTVPVTHLSKHWHIEIPFDFCVPMGKGPRDPIIGGQPEMVLEYSAWDLPETIQQQLEHRQ